MRQDFRYAFRTLCTSPGFTIVAVLTLALAIGANSAIFSVMEGVLLRPLPFDPEGRLVEVNARDAQGQRQFVSQPDLDDWRAMSKSFDGLASWVPQSVTLTGLDQPERLIGLFVSANFLIVIGVVPAIGRGFAPGEDRTGGERVAVLSDRLWHTRFAGNPAVLGQSIQLNGEPYTIVGVLPAYFVFPNADADVYLPAFKYPNYSLNRAQTSCAVIGRLHAGATIQTAQSEMDGVTARLAAAYPDSNNGRGATVVSFRENLVDRRRPTMIALTGAVAFVLLIGCANIAGLLIARMVTRERERAVRIALGASRARLVSQVAAEVVVLAGVGGLLGLLLAAWTVSVIAASIAVYLPNGITIQLDRGVMRFAAGVSVLSDFDRGASGMAEFDWRIAARGSRSRIGSRKKSDARPLVTAEIALALVLLAGAALMMKSVAEISRQQPGFDPHHLLTLQYRVPRNKYPTGALQAEFHREVVEKIKAVPGVIGAAAVRATPLGSNGNFTDFLLTDRPEPPIAERPRALLNFSDPDFFSTMRIPLLRGRVFNEHDLAAGNYVIVVGETLAQRYFGGRDPIGQHLRLPSLNQTGEIIGVVGDVKQFDLRDPATPEIWGAVAQNPFIFTEMVVRTAGDPLAMANAIRRAVWQVDKDQPVWGVDSLEEILNRIGAHGLPALVTGVLGGYAALALILASIGIFGLVSYAVSQRTSEIGVRMALGARPGDVARLVLRQGFTLALSGIAIGAIAAAWLSRYLASQLYDVSPFDPAVYAIVALLLAAVALAACVVPLYRAMRVDPIQALRHE